MEERIERIKKIAQMWHNCDITTEYAAECLASVVPSGGTPTVYATLLDEVFRLHALSLDALLTMAVNDA